MERRVGTPSLGMKTYAPHAEEAAGRVDTHTTNHMANVRLVMWHARCWTMVCGAVAVQMHTQLHTTHGEVAHVRNAELERSAAAREAAPSSPKRLLLK